MILPSIRKSAYWSAVGRAAGSGVAGLWGSGPVLLWRRDGATGSRSHDRVAATGWCRHSAVAPGAAV